MAKFFTIDDVRLAYQDRLLIALVPTSEQLRLATSTLKKKLKTYDDAPSGLLILSSRVPGVGLSGFAKEEGLASARISIYLDDTREETVGRLEAVAEEQFRQQRQIFEKYFAVE